VDIGLWFVTQLVNVGTVADVQTGGIAYVAHVGGFIFGCMTARLFEREGRAVASTASTKNEKS
jgi:membrane associated rhomboid family serine protease